MGRARKVLVKAPERQVAKQISIWDGWDDAGTSGGVGGVDDMDVSEDEPDLEEFGL